MEKVIQEDYSPPRAIRKPGRTPRLINYPAVQVSGERSFRRSACAQVLALPMLFG
jgi:hypothetical protein